jgi:hypothetical protein
MALRAVPDHPKFTELKRLLNRPKGAALGYLECVWHFTGRFTPQGNIGKYSDAAIEAWVEWDGEAGAMIEALIQSKWLDHDPAHRILVHDWPQHADKSTKQTLTRSRLQFCAPTVGFSARDFQSSSLEDQSRLHEDRFCLHEDQSRLHEGSQNDEANFMKPLPVPEPVPESGAVPGKLLPFRAVEPEDDFEILYSRHPQAKRRSRGIALNYYASAIINGADAEVIDKIHAAMCETESWRWKDGIGAPTLDQWLLDQGWKYSPDAKARDSPQSLGAAYMPYVDPLRGMV